MSNLLIFTRTRKDTKPPIVTKSHNVPTPIIPPPPVLCQQAQNQGVRSLLEMSPVQGASLCQRNIPSTSWASKCAVPRAKEVKSLLPAKLIPSPRQSVKETAVRSLFVEDKKNVNKPIESRKDKCEFKPINSPQTSGVSNDNKSMPLTQFTRPDGQTSFGKRTFKKHTNNYSYNPRIVHNKCSRIMETYKTKHVNPIVVNNCDTNLKICDIWQQDPKPEFMERRASNKCRFHQNICSRPPMKFSTFFHTRKYLPRRFAPIKIILKFLPYSLDECQSWSKTKWPIFFATKQKNKNPWKFIMKSKKIQRMHLKHKIPYALKFLKPILDVILKSTDVLECFKRILYVALIKEIIGDFTYEIYESDDVTNEWFDLF